MNQTEITAIFEQQAAGYDAQWQHMWPVNDCLYLLLKGVFKSLKKNAHILCVGAGTGHEVVELAQRYPEMQFTVVEPAKAMMDLCQSKLKNAGLDDRCNFMNGYVESLSTNRQFDAATAFLVSHFMVDQEERVSFFQQIAQRLKSGGVFINTDLTADIQSSDFQALLNIWFATMAENMPEEQMQQMKKAYSELIGVIPQHRLQELIKASGFHSSFCFYQAGLIQGFMNYLDM